MELENIGIIGAGVMGSGIAQVCATAGYHVILEDVSSEILDKSKTSIERSLGKLVSKGKMAEAEKRSTLSRIQSTKDLKTACQGTDLIVEAVFEDLALKQGIFKQFEKYCEPKTILG